MVTQYNLVVEALFKNTRREQGSHSRVLLRYSVPGATDTGRIERVSDSVQFVRYLSERATWQECLVHQDALLASGGGENVFDVVGIYIQPRQDVSVELVQSFGRDTQIRDI
ncbi:hypothetical protein RRF57_011646 [Xylaria bambusicola]|uniref:Uncharacterized protein n=1 Tax=Xylaria bambusicola TaxID=326684 RepID=A0AAN7UX15_9PEZI